MTLARREVLVGGAAVLGAGALLASSRRSAPQEALAVAAPPHGDMLVLVAGGRGDAWALKPFVAARPGRTIVRQVTPLTRKGFAKVARLIDGARGAHVVVLADAAESLVAATLLERAGATPVNKNVAGLGEILLARLA